MTKRELIATLAEKQPDLRAQDLEAVVELIFESMARALGQDERIEIRGFGVFVAKVREARKGLNPSNGERVQVPKKRTPFFTAGKEIRERVQAEFENQQTEKRH